MNTMKQNDTPRRTLNFTWWRSIFWAISVFLFVAQVQAANFPLQIILPRAGNTAPDPGAPLLSPDHFSLWAYPGIAYRMRAAVIGGTYPYSFTLTDQPAGMTVDSRGVITWPNPLASDSSITLTITDSEGNQAQTTWSIAVEANKFRFLDCDVATSGTGTISNPWKNLDNIPSGVGSESVGRILYFRDCSASGFYNALAPGYRTTSDRKDYRSDIVSQQWLGYPGERPILNIGYQVGGEAGVVIRFQSQPAAFVNFETINGHNKHLNTIPSTHYAVFWSNYMHGDAGQDGANAAFIMTESGATLSEAYYTIIQDNEFADYGHRNGGNAGSCIKFYSQRKALIEGNTCRDAVGQAEIEGIALKGGTMDRLTIRGNTVYNVAEHAIGGNNHILHNSEILFNRVYNADTALYLNQDGLITTPIFVYRNTFLGDVRIDHVGAGSGPFYLYSNVIVTNSPLDTCKLGSRMTCFDVTDSSRITTADSLEGSVSDGITNGTGLLSPAYSSSIGLRGHELGVPLDFLAPAPPTGVRVD